MSDELERLLRQDAMQRGAVPVPELPGLYTPMLVPKLTIMCAPDGYTAEDLQKDLPTVGAQWAADLRAEGHHVTDDAIEGYWNAAGGFVGLADHTGHPHVVLTCMVADPGRKN